MHLPLDIRQAAWSGQTLIACRATWAANLQSLPLLFKPVPPECPLDLRSCRVSTQASAILTLQVLEPLS